MSAHTPGPWSREGLDVSVYGKGTIAKCPVPQDGGVFECSANARLIAAAPEMLEALQAWLDSDVAQSQAEEKALIEKMKAAVAKATGEA